MSNLWLVIKREYLTRVRRRTFILTTLLTPIGIALFAVVANAIFSYQNDDVQRIAVIDEGNLFNGSLPDENGLYFRFVDRPFAELQQDEQSREDYVGILIVPEITNPRARDFRVQLFSDETLSLDAQLGIRNRIRDRLREYKIDALDIDQATLASLDTDVDIKVRSLTEEDGETEDRSMTSAIGAGIGTAMGFLMYGSIFFYGMMVMRSVMEEKTNRIVEVVISSVHPFTLLLGKIIGVGAVGLTQVLAWIIMIPGLFLLANLIFGFDAPDPQLSAGAEVDPAEMQSLVERLLSGLSTLNWYIIVPCFILYFLGGYFMYSAMFAAVGSAMGDDMGESQTLTIPITIPVILAFYIMLAALQNPNSSLAVWSSIFPLFAPIVMPARLAFEPPLWQILASLVSVALFAAFMVWVASRIYRIGILNYGKKSTLKDMGKWITAKY